MTPVSPSNTNLENVTLRPVVCDPQGQYVPAGITTLGVVIYPEGLGGVA